MSHNTYPRETVEFIPIAVTIDDVEVTTGIEVAIAQRGARPTTWQAPTTLDTRIGILISGLTPGTWHIWARATAAPETVVIDCGPITIT